MKSEDALGLRASAQALAHCLPGRVLGFWLFHPLVPWVLPGLILTAPVSPLLWERPVFSWCPFPLVEAWIQQGASGSRACALQRPLSRWAVPQHCREVTWQEVSPHPGPVVHLCLAVAILWGLPICHGLGQRPMGRGD